VSETKKRLPVLKQTPEEEQGEGPRPAWHWVGFGACATFGVALPLSYVTQVITARLLPNEPLPPEAAIAINFAPILIAGFLGGMLVGRWGGDNAGVREAAFAGGIAQLLMVILAIAQNPGMPGWQPYAIWAAMICFVSIAAAIGGKVGLRRRIKKMTPNLR